uniref:Uncharacterized protein n=1 Tax=Candidatus Kentrum sp. UNK TaxID=2126344 RepID=A0A450ZVZ1_9GAMM|nr:MAG: hypothetical protein BECKUNK1418G_GA0071005_100159 [Candidatus Kentron sp. UNK]VFK69728.1 MAG: hypothetical protein BECKUNK1418H_GA0071006_101826 [Candidatus Kentron sp. UNK]
MGVASYNRYSAIPPPEVSFAWFIPSIFGFLSALRSLALLLEARSAGTYIQKIEAYAKNADNDEIEGWETWLQEQDGKPVLFLYLYGAVSFWIIFLTFTLFGGILLSSACS